MSQLTQEHFDEVITGFKQHVDERFENVDERLDRIDGRLDVIEKRLEELADYAALRENFHNLENRVLLLETTQSR